MDFGEVLTKAWKIIWKFKILWIFGILTSCGQGNNGGGNGSSSLRYSLDNQNLPPGFRQFSYNLDHYFDYIQGWQIAAIVVGFIVFMFLLIAIFSAISAVGRIGLIQGTVKAENEAERLSFQELFSSGKPFFWRVFGFNLLAGLVILFAVLLLLVPMIGFGIVTIGVGLLCLIPLLCLLIPVSWLVNLVIEQANIAIVAEDLNILDGVKRGWEVFRDNIGNLIVMGLILGIGGWIVGLLLAIPFLLTLFPSLIGIISGSATDSDFLFGSGIAVSILCFVTYLPVLIVLGGILQAYLKTAWTLTYLRLTTATTPDDGTVAITPNDGIEELPKEETDQTVLT